MSAVAVVTIFYNYLELNYSGVAFYKNAFNVIAIILLPVFGKLIGKIDVRIFAIITYSALLLYYFFMGLTEYFPGYFEFFGIKLYYFLLVSVIFNGIFTASMALLWYIGSAYFCKSEEAADYQSIHLSLTGVRAIFTPIVGILFYRMLNFTGTFTISIISLIIAITITYISYKKRKVAVY